MILFQVLPQGVAVDVLIIGLVNVGVIKMKGVHKADHGSILVTMRVANCIGLLMSGTGWTLKFCDLKIALSECEIDANTM